MPVSRPWGSADRHELLRNCVLRNCVLRTAYCETAYCETELLLDLLRMDLLPNGSSGRVSRLKLEGLSPRTGSGSCNRALPATALVTLVQSAQASWIRRSVTFIACLSRIVDPAATFQTRVHSIQIEHLHGVPTSLGISPAEFVQPCVVDTEMMPNFVDDGAPHLLDYLGFVTGD